MTANTIFGQAWSTPTDTCEEVSNDSDSDENIQGFRGKQVWPDSGIGEEVFGEKRVHYKFLQRYC